MKEQYLQFIKNFSKINVKAICKELKIDRTNILNGRASEETTKKLYDEIKKRLRNLN